MEEQVIKKLHAWAWSLKMECGRLGGALDLYNVGGLRAFLTFNHVELNAFTFSE